MPEFKFQIGQVVTSRVALEECKRRCEAGDRSFPILGMVVERHTGECYAGVQHNYKVARLGEAQALNEIELVDAAEIDYASMRATAAAVSERLAHAEQLRWEVERAAARAEREAAKKEKPPEAKP